MQEFVSDYYGKKLSSSQDLKTNACCATGAPPAWITSRLNNVSEAVTSRFYGCGYPIPHGLSNATVLDLGCGTGRDVFIISQLIGSEGKVYGLDMTEEQLLVARQTEQWHADKFGYTQPNTTFYQGYIEDLQASGIEDESIDVVVSNCVVNLSPRKDLVLCEVYRVLKQGGEFYISDVVADRRLRPEIANDPVLHAECLGGALYEADFLSLAKKAGFTDPRLVSRAPITVQNQEINEKVGNARFYSATYRLFKIEGLDDQCEDYGQLATYKGGILGAESLFWLDDHHAFEAHRPERICANTAAMLEQTRFSKWFEIQGSKTQHFGVFDCGLTMAATDFQTKEQLTSFSSCC
ncbi:MAG: methyltransferase domain-containing protein [Cyanothece sp. SIO2G6]|nr:methyltransferase domain-containing protein [Cyanothece sp. SIO2G6]